MPPRLLLALTAVAAAIAIVAPAAHAWQPFAPDSVWRLPLRADAPVDPDPNGMIAALQTEIARESDPSTPGLKGPTLNTTTCGFPIYQADNTRNVPVKLASSAFQDLGLISAWSSVPMPLNAVPASCTDADVLVVDEAADTMWEFFKASLTGGQWTAQWGGAMTHVSQDRGYYSRASWPAGVSGTRLWGTTATSIPQLGGLPLISELQSGHVDHALALMVPDARKVAFMWPAQRTDGTLTSPNAIYEGARLRIDPSLDLNTLNLTPVGRMLAVAAQKYGMIIRDKTTSVVAIPMEDPSPLVRAGQPNPYLGASGLFGGLTPREVLGNFPWDHLQLMAGTVCANANQPCLQTPKAVLQPSDSSPVVGEPVTLDTTNSTLNAPRKTVAWDLDGDGIYETPDDSVTHTFSSSVPGDRTVGVKIIDQDGVTVTASTPLSFGTPSATSPEPSTEPSTDPSTGLPAGLLTGDVDWPAIWAAIFANQPPDLEVRASQHPRRVTLDFTGTHDPEGAPALVMIDWGDNSPAERATTRTVSHRYTSGRVHHVRIGAIDPLYAFSIRRVRARTPALNPLP